MTQLFNILYNLVCLLAMIGSETEFLSIVPAKWKHEVTVICGLALVIKSHWNLFINPNGTPAAVPYNPGPPPAPPVPPAPQDNK